MVKTGIAILAPILRSPKSAKLTMYDGCPICTVLRNFHCATPCTVTSSPLFVRLNHISAASGTVLGSRDSCYLQTILSFQQDKHEPWLLLYRYITFIVKKNQYPINGTYISLQEVRRVLITTSSSETRKLRSFVALLLNFSENT